MSKPKSRTSAKRSPFGELLLKLRTERGLTQERLAEVSRGDRISSRSITNYERAVKDAKDWVLPHRPALRLLTDVLNLDLVSQRELVMAWSQSRSLRDASASTSANISTEDASGFVSAGREAAVDSIMDAWSLAQAGEPQVVFVGGIAGIGKTELMRHISDKIAASTREVMIAWGGASAWATSVEPYLAVRTATDRLVAEPDPTSTLPGRYPSRPKLDSRETARIIESIPLLGGALISDRALREMAARNRERDLAAVDSALATRSSTNTVGRLDEYCRLIVDLAKSWPIVFVLEDLHWAGEPTATLMLHLVHHLRHQQDTPVLFLCTYRNNEVDSDTDSGPQPFARLLDAIGHSPLVRNVKLNETMSPTSGMAYIRGIIQQTPMADSRNEEQLASWLYEQTSGHPLLTSEIMRHLAETGALAAANGDNRWIFHPESLPPDMPSAVSTFIEQRLKRVSRRGRRILEVASTMDDMILTDIIADIMEIDSEDLLDLIDNHLVDPHQLLLPDQSMVTSQRSHISYRFPHALFREHIYGRLSSSRQKKLHGAVAQAMENRFADPDTTTLGEITSHYIAAEDWHSAQISGYRLAQDATMRLDWDLATVWFEQADELAIRAQDPHQLWRGRAARLAVMRGLSEYDEARTLGDRIIELAERQNWPKTLALANHHLGEIYYDLGQVNRSVELLKRAIALHLQEGSLDLAAAGEAMVSHATHRQGKFDVARKHAMQAIAYGSELQNNWVHPEAVLAAANCETELGFYKQAIANYEISIELAELVGKLSNQYIPAMNIGLCNVQLGKFELAVEQLTELITRMDFHGSFRLHSHAVLYLGYAYEGLGMWEEARETYAEASKARRVKAGIPVLMDSLAGELRAALHRGDSDHARALLGEITNHLALHDWEGIEDPLLVKVTVARAHAYFKDDQGYQTFIERAHALLMERAGMLEDEESVTSYLTAVPVNVELQKLYAAL